VELVELEGAVLLAIEEDLRAQEMGVISVEQRGTHRLFIGTCMGSSS